MSATGENGRLGGDVAHKIAALVEEKGWNQEDFARISNLNRHTVRQILHGGPERRLRNATVSQCAEAFGLTVNELRTLPLERLLMRVHGKVPVDEEAVRRLYEQATQVDLKHWLERNQDRAVEFRPDEIQELLSLQEPGGAIEQFGAEQVVERIERRRRILCQVRDITASEFSHCLETLVTLLHEKLVTQSRTPR